MKMKSVSIFLLIQVLAAVVGIGDNYNRNNIMLTDSATIIREKREVEEIKEPKPTIPSYVKSIKLPLDSKDKAVKTSDLDEDLLKWEAPLHFQKSLPYYQSGFDDEGRPVWVVELGKLPVTKLTALDEEGFKILDKYIRQAAVRLIRSMELVQNTTEHEVTGIVSIVDMDGLEVIHFANPRIPFLLLRVFGRYTDLITKYLNTCFTINVNYVAELAISVARPFLGRAFEKIEFYGTNAAKWKAALSRRLPKESLPPWYGGSKDFKPVAVYG